MAEVARNLIHRPLFESGGTSPAWVHHVTSGTGQVPSPVGTHTNTGTKLSDFPVLQVRSSFKPHAELHGLTAGDTLQVWVSATIPTADALYIGVHDTLNGADRAVGDPAAVWIDGDATPNRVFMATLTVPDLAQHRLRLSVKTTTHRAVHGVRASVQDEPDELGIFDGNTPDTETVDYGWTGEPEQSESVALAIVPEPDPDPDPEPGDPDDPAALPLARRVAAYLGRADDTETIALAELHTETVAAYVYGYTRGRGFTDDGRPAPDLQHVIVAAAATLTSNPEQVSYYSTGDYSERPAVLAGWTLPQLGILHRYRRRQA